MRKIIFLILSLIMALTVDLSAESITSSGSDECVMYSLTANKSTISTNEQIMFTFDYSAKQPICSEEQILDSKIEIDFSNLVNSGNDITASFNNEALQIDISSTGIISISFLDLSHEDETLSDFGGSISFTIIAGDLTGDEVVITDSVGNEVVIDVGNGKETQNTNKVSAIDYAKVDDIVDYTILVNGDYNQVDEFYGVDSASAGMEYVPGSFWVEEDQTWTRNDELFTASLNEEGHLVVANNTSFDSAYLLHYQMQITSEQSSYTNQFDATYDTHTDSVSDQIEYDLDGDSWTTYDQGQIEITKLSEDELPLAGAEFDLYNSENQLVEHLITDENGIALSDKHSFGEYYLLETLAPVGYELSDELIPVTIANNDMENITSISVYNDAIQGKVEVYKVNESNEPLSGVEFTIYSVEDEEIATIVTDEEGYGLSDNLPYGDYYLVESETNEGYVLDDTIYPFTISSSNIASVNDGKAIINYKYQEPTIELPIVEVPETETPETITPEVPTIDPVEPTIELPIVEVPETETPETITPEVPETDPVEPTVELPIVETTNSEDNEQVDEVTKEDEKQFEELTNEAEEANYDENKSVKDNNVVENNENAEVLASTAVKLEIKHIAILLFLICIVVLLRRELR